MKLLKINNLIKLCFAFLITSRAWGTEVASTHLQAAAVKDADTKQRIISAVSTAYREDDLDDKQVIRLEQNGKTVFLAPSVNLGAKSNGCYLTIVDGSASVTDRILVHKAEDALTCETILAVFVCNVPNQGVGVVYGLRLGADKYYTEAGFFEFNPKGRLMENKDLSRKIGNADTARKAKSMLGCKQ